MSEWEETPTADIAGLQFGLLTDDVIRSWKLPEVEALITKKNSSYLGTINCASRGPSNASSLCLTCGNDFEHCQHHAAQITWFAPVINVNFIQLLIKILPTICIRCFRVLMPDELLQQLLQGRSSTNNSYRKCVKDMHKLCMKTNRVCWFPPVKKTADEKSGETKETEEKEQPHMLSLQEAKKRGYCGAVQPDTWITYEKFLIRPAWYIFDESEYEQLPKITPDKLSGMLRFIMQNAIRLYGFDPEHSPLHGMMNWLFYVPPPILRLPNTSGKSDDLTIAIENMHAINKNADRSKVLNLTIGIIIPHELQKVQKNRLQDKDADDTDEEESHNALLRSLANMNVKTRAKLRRYQGEMSKKLTRHHVPVISKCLEDYYLLQREYATYIDSKYATVLDREYVRNPVCLRRRSAPKGDDHGRYRGNMLGKPCDFTIRSVSSPNTDMDIDEVGIPLIAAMAVTIPVVVTPYNFNDMIQIVKNGVKKYPGCNFVQIGATYYAPDADYGGLKLGYVVHRHLRDGDGVIANRAPSLHRFAIMGYRARIHPHATINGHLCVTLVLNEDYDGDEKNVCVPQSELARAEIINLITVKNNLIRDGELVISCVQHAPIGAEQLTNENYKPWILKRSDVLKLIMIGNNTCCRNYFVANWEKFNKSTTLTGREFMKLLLPTYDGTYTLTKKLLNGCIHATITGPGDMEKTSYLIGFLTRILESIASESGTSILLDDILFENSPQTKEEANNIFNDAVRHDTAMTEDKSSHKLGTVEEEDENETEEEEEEVKENGMTLMPHVTSDEDLICQLLSRYRDTLGKPVIAALANKPYRCSGINTIVSSGAKGDATAIVQNLQVVGQQNNENSVRYQETTSHYYRDSCSRHGFARHALLDSLTPTEYHFLLCAGRYGLVCTYGGTANAGYNYRKIFKTMEDERICFGNTVRNGNDQVIMFYYGWDSTFLKAQPLITVSLNIVECVQRFATNNDAASVLEVENLLLLRQRVLTSNHPQLSILFPLRFDQTCERVLCDGKHRCIKVSLNAARNRVCKLWTQLVTNYFIPATPLHELCFFEQLSSRYMRDREYLKCTRTFDMYLKHIEDILVSNLCATGDACGMKCSQDTTQPGTQASLSLFHIAGEKITGLEGTARFKEIINLPKTMQQPMMEIYILPEFEDSFKPLNLIELRLEYIVEQFSDTIVGDDWETHCAMYANNVNIHNSDSLVHLNLHLNKLAMHRRELSPRAIMHYLRHIRILQFDSSNVVITHANLTDDVWWIMITIPRSSRIWNVLAPSASMQSATLALLLYQTLKADKMLLSGIERLRDFNLIEKSYIAADKNNDGKLITVKRKCILTKGSNLQAVCALPEVDVERTCSNDIVETYRVYGIDVAESLICEGLMESMNISYDSPASQHVKLIAATMCCSGYPSPMNYAGMTQRETANWLQRLLFERSHESMNGCGIMAEFNNLRGVSPAIMVGAPISIGTGGDFDVLSSSPNITPHNNANLAQTTEAVFFKRKQKPMGRLTFEKPDLKDFLTRVKTSQQDTSDNIDFRLDPPIDEKHIESRKPTTHKRKACSTLRIGTKTKRSKDVYLTANKGLAVFVPSSPVSRISNTCNFTQDIFIPSSP